ncbi:hypothetical protein [uncultured Arcobacter sp.]|uniref:hypothetical protein n=1 Tax=uncultured Arcobacter sp. TaxID=165434 RepID=UPI0026353858|nr:hypothetical protein [uncultured Arcobacter sp.]
MAVKTHPNIIIKNKINKILYDKTIEHIDVELLKAFIRNNLDISKIANFNLVLYKYENPSYIKTFEYLYRKYSYKNYSELIYILYNDIEPPKCSVCGIHNQNFISFKRGYSGFCSKSCASKKANQIRAYSDLIKEELTEYEIRKLVILLMKSDKYSLYSPSQSFKTHDINLYNNIINRTNYLQENCKFTERLYHIVNGLYKNPTCVKCGNTIDVKFKTFNNGYGSYCKTCINKKTGMKIGNSTSKTKREQNFQQIINKFSDDYICLTKKNEFVETGIMSVYHHTCGKTIKREQGYYNYGCPYCKKSGRSNIEKEIRDFLTLFIKGDILLNTKPLKDDSKIGNAGNREIDIYIPDKKIGIEYHGLYWHTESNGKNNKYHLDKYNMANENDIQLLQIFSNEWIYKNDIVKSIIKSKLGVYDNRLYARKCEVREIDNQTKDKFLDENHLQGKDISKHRFGLYYNDELISVMTFGKRNISGQSTFELIRYACKLNTQIIGGASKLFKYFINNYWNGEAIKTYADKRYSNGSLYHQLGFKYTHDSKPNYWYTKDYKTVEHRANYMKHKLKDKLSNYDENLTEWENMKLNGYDRIWDCGNMVFEYNNLNN